MHLTPWSRCPPQGKDVISPYPKRLNVHHFKWMSGQLEASWSKAHAYFNTSTSQIYQNVLKYLRKCGGICVDDTRIKCKIFPPGRNLQKILGRTLHATWEKKESGH